MELKEFIVAKLASSNDRRDEAMNLELAEDVANNENKEAVDILTGLMLNAKKAIQSNCVKVLYEIGERKPQLISEKADSFFQLLSSKDNRMQWGAMAALNQISKVNPSYIHKRLNEVLIASDKGSVITKDNAVGILINLASIESYNNNMIALLFEQIKMSPPNQVPMYAERMAHLINKSNNQQFIAALLDRKSEMQTESKMKRIDKIIKKVS